MNLDILETIKDKI